MFSMCLKKAAKYFCIDYFSYHLLSYPHGFMIVEDSDDDN